MQQTNLIEQYKLNMFKSYRESLSLALNFPFVELANSLKEMQVTLAKSLILAINPLAVEYIYPHEINESEVQEKVSNCFGLTMTVDGSFYFKGDLIDTVTTGSKHGKFLKMLLTNEDNYVSDKIFLETIDVADENKGIGYIRRDLKKYLRRVGIEIKIRRIRNQGHKLVRVYRLLN